MSLSLRPMTAVEYQVFLTQAITDYAADKVEAKAWLAADALSLSKTAFERLLPLGIDTPHHLLFTAMLDHEPIGSLWAMIEEHLDFKSAFLYEIKLDPAYQNQGLGTRVMGLLEAKLKDMQVKRLSLHVFAKNQRALHVYQKCGFELTDYNLSKDFD